MSRCRRWEIIALLYEEVSSAVLVSFFRTDLLEQGYPTRVARVRLISGSVNAAFVSFLL